MRHRSLPHLLPILLVVFLAPACARVHPHIAMPNLALGEPSFFPTLEAYASAPIVGGNRADLLLNGEQIFPAMLEAIRGAQRTITYAQYFYEDGPIARDLAESMAERCRAAHRAERRGLCAGRQELARGGQLRDVQDVPARGELRAALDPHHQPVLRDRRADARRADRGATAQRARARAGARLHRPQHRAP